MPLDKKDQAIAELRGTLDAIPPETVTELEERIRGAREIFCIGYGRSGLCSSGFAMRLMHLGLKSNSGGEMTAHPIGQGDLLIVTSASGSSKTLMPLVRKARSLGAQVALITTNRSSALAGIADVTVHIPAQTKCDTVETSVMPMGSIFEEAAFVMFDLIVADLMEQMQITNEEMVRRHANLE
jgi:6-phospho-3-hexuloisomerase